MIANEMNRAAKFMAPGDRTRLLGAYERALELTDLTVRVHPERGLRRELLRWRDLVARLYAEPESDPDQHAVAYRCLLRFTSTASRQLGGAAGLGRSVALALLLALALLVPAGAGATLLFGAPEYWPAGAGPRALALADLDQDGCLDAVTVNDSLNAIQVLLGDGMGGFAAPVPLTTGSGPVDIAAVDFNLDGDPDLVTADSTGNTASVFFGAAGSTFAARVPYPVNAGPMSICIGPGYWGVAPGFITVGASGRTSHYEGDGQGNFFWRTDWPAGPSPVDVVAFDFDHDGTEDLMVANAAPAADPGRITLMNALYEYYDRYYYYVIDSLAAPAVPRAVAAADLDGDGWMDLAAVSGAAGGSGGALTVWPGDGATPFEAGTTIATPEFLSKLTAADVDYDEDLDLVAAGGPGGDLVVFLNDGGFLARDCALSLGEPVGDIAVGLVDDDDWPDLVVSLHESGRIALLRGGSTAGAGGPTVRGPALALLPPRPNPARGNVALSFRVPAGAPARVEIRDVRGRLVRRLFSGRLEGTTAGLLEWDLRGTDGAPVPSGTYFVMLESDGRRQAERVTVLR